MRGAHVRHTADMRHDQEPAALVAARRAGVSDPRVLAAVAVVSRDRFVPSSARGQSDRDRPLAIGHGQTTSQPSLIAAMLAALQLTGDERVLEVGTGFGYQTALLAHLAAEVVTIERVGALADVARDNLAACGLGHVTVVTGDGTRGVPERAPYDAVVVSAATATVPPALGQQLVDGGRLVAPVGGPDLQEVVIHEARDGVLREVQRTTRVRFVPLIADPDPRDAPERR